MKNDRDWQSLNASLTVGLVIVNSTETNSHATNTEEKWEIIKLKREQRAFNWGNKKTQNNDNNKDIEFKWNKKALNNDMDDYWLGERAI